MGRLSAAMADGADGAAITAAIADGVAMEDITITTADTAVVTGAGKSFSYPFR